MHHGFEIFELTDTFPLLLYVLCLSFDQIRYSRVLPRVFLLQGQILVLLDFKQVNLLKEAGDIVHAHLLASASLLLPIFGRTGSFQLYMKIISAARSLGGRNRCLVQDEVIFVYIVAGSQANTVIDRQ